MTGQGQTKRTRARSRESDQSKPTRRPVAAVLTDRELVSIGRKVRRLRGDPADQVRALLKL
jgi:hypothetical protein